MNAKFNNRLHLGVGAADELLLADNSGNRVRTIELPTLLAGNSGQPTQFISPSFTLPNSVAGYAIGPLQPNTFRKVKMSFSVPFPAAMSFYVTIDANTDLQIPPDAQTGAASDNVLVRTIAGPMDGSLKYADGAGPNARFQTASCLAGLPNGEVLIYDTGRVRLVTKLGATYTVIGSLGATLSSAGNGRNNVPAGSPNSIVATDSSDVFFYITNSAIYRVYVSGNRYNAGSWYFNRIAGGTTTGDVEGIGSVARFDNAYHGFYEPISATLYLGDAGNNKIKAVRYLSGNIDSDANWYVSNVAGSTSGFADGANPQFNTPTSVAPAPNGGFYVADYTNNRIRLVTAQGTATTVAGNGSLGSVDGAASTLATPLFLAADTLGNIYFNEASTATLRVYRNGRVESVVRYTPGAAVDGTGSQFRGFYRPFGVSVDPSSGDVWMTDATRICLIQRIVR